MYYRSGGLIILASAVLLVVGLGRLLWERRWLRALIVIAAVVGFPLITLRIVRIEDDHLRLWVAMLAAVLVPMWLLCGFFVDALSRRDPALTADPRVSPKRRLAGAALALVGAAFWLYGATHPTMTKTEGVMVLAGALYSLLIGSYWLGTGKRLSD
jgi:hypothetical protein